jgi:hypothetical protein
LDLRRYFNKVPRGKFGFRRCMEYFNGLGPRKLIAKMVPHRH